MTVTEYNFRLIALDDERVFLIPIKGDGRELSKKDAEHVLRIVGADKKTKPWLIESVNNDIQPILDGNQVSILSELLRKEDTLTVKQLSTTLKIRTSSIASCLYRLERLKMVSRTISEHGSNQPHLWHITDDGNKALNECLEEEPHV